MVITKPHNQKTLQLTLYSGVALVVISMLFLGRQQQSTSFAVQALTVLAVPALFYAVGMLVWRYLRTPLAAPGLIATGAWLVGVGLIHLYDQRVLLPYALQPYYWLGASLLAGVLITITGHRVRIWMLVPLVPLVQTNSAWAVMSALGVDVKWMPALTFLLVFAWWEMPFKDDFWITVYRASGVLLTLLVLLFSLWLPLTIPQSLMITWGAGAGLVALLGLRHGWARMGPLSIIILFCATIWGLPQTFWPVAWTGLGLVTIIFIERLTTREEKGKDAKAIEISEALAIVLCGGAAVFAQLSATFSNTMWPAVQLSVLLGTGLLMLWLGWRRELLSAIHIGLWLTASAWALVYFIALPASNVFGLWLALFATSALLIERLLSSRNKEKRKSGNTIAEAVVRWPVADLVIGLSAAIILWAALNINTVPPFVLAVTTSIVVGLWLAAGLVYRLPVLLHTALWIAPLPYALLLLIAAPAIWTLPLLGVAWQILGVIFLLLGHSLHRYRPAILAPFFIVGYVLLGFGFTMAATLELLLPITLGIVVLACIMTSIAVIADYHPIWSLFVAWALPCHRLPYANKHFNHLFLFLSAWLAAIWLHLMLGYTGIPVPRQGVFLVGFAALWFALGRMLSGLLDVPGWTVSSAGWLMWLIGLLEVFFSPTEAILTMILGLAISGEALRRSQAVYWIPVFILQFFFTILQIVWMLTLPGWIVLTGVAFTITVGGMIYEYRAERQGRIIALTGGVLTIGIWLLHLNVYTLLVIILLVTTAILRYQRWQGIFVLDLSLVLLLLQSNLIPDWRILFMLGLAQFVVGAELVKFLRPAKHRTLVFLLLGEGDWATPFLWNGLVLTLIAWSIAFFNRHYNKEGIIFTVVAVGVFAFYSIRLHIRYLAHLTLLTISAGLLSLLLWIPQQQPLNAIADEIMSFTAVLAFFALLARWYCVRAIVQPRLLTHIRWAVWWIRPLLGVSFFLNAVSLVLLIVLSSVYHPNLVLQIVTILLLAAYTILMYNQRHQVGWLWISLLLIVYGWLLSAHALNLSGNLAYTLPIGLGLLGAARLIQSTEYRLLDGAGIIVLLIGSAWDVNTRDLLTVPTVTLAIQLLALAAYGYYAGRRIPFTGSLVIMLCSVIWMIIRINVWLIPLAAGLTLLAIVILAEAQAETLERWIQGWKVRWQQWK